jgi:hypothetical protein
MAGIRAPAMHVRAQPLPSLRALVLVLVGLCWIVAPARAELGAAVVLDGPSASILDVDGAAMAPDGSGGVLYRMLVAGQPHLFVSRFLDGHWQAPVQVDAGQPFGASFPAIAAGEGGRLLVVWAEPWATINQVTTYELMSAEMAPGATQFAAAIQIDPKDIGDGTAAYPSLAMAPDGQAYVAYRVVTNSLVGSSIVPLRPGDEQIDVRVARYNGQGLDWSSLGNINDHLQLTMRHPSASNAPVIGIDRAGNAVVAWQEPDASGVARILARRIFGNRVGTAVLDVSPTTVNGQPVTAEADAPAIAVGTFGEAKIAFRLAGGAGSPYGSARILMNTLPSEVDPNGAKLQGLTVLAGAPTLGPPSISSDAVGEYRAAFTAGAGAQLVGGDNEHPPSAPLTLGATTAAQTPTVINPTGGDTTAWSSVSPGGLPAIAAREDFPAGGWQSALLSAPISGPVGAPVLGGSGNGDALIAFAQGPPEEQQVMAAVAKAPPGKFIATAPIGWVRGSAATITWEAPAEAFGSTTYEVLVDGRIAIRGLSGLSARLDSRGLGDGVHRVQVLATDGLGQQTMTAPATLKVDANPPEATVKHMGRRGVRVRISDRASGALAGATSIAFGDGTRAVHKLSVRHTYAREGTYTIVVHSRDRVGNTLNISLKVRVG